MFDILQHCLLVPQECLSGWSIHCIHSFIYYPKGFIISIPLNFTKKLSTTTRTKSTRSCRMYTELLVFGNDVNVTEVVLFLKLN